MAIKINGNTVIDNDKYGYLDRMYIGADQNDGYFYSDVNGRTAFRDGQFYIQNTVPYYYNYASVQYHGGTNGDSHLFRANTLSGDNWDIDAVGNAEFPKVTTGSHVNTGEWAEIWCEITMGKTGAIREVNKTSTNYGPADCVQLTDLGGSLVAENGYLMFGSGVPNMTSPGNCFFWGSIGGGPTNSNNNWLTYPFSITKHQTQALNNGLMISIVLSADEGGTTVWGTGAVSASILLRYQT